MFQVINLDKLQASIQEEFQTKNNMVNKGLVDSIIGLPTPTPDKLTVADIEDIPEEVQEKISGLNPAGALVNVDEIAATVLFLCSGRATMINGHDIPLDGGQLAKL